MPATFCVSPFSFNKIKINASNPYSDTDVYPENASNTASKLQKQHK
jgi:hypothetical protein